MFIWNATNDADSFAVYHRAIVSDASTFGWRIGVAGRADLHAQHSRHARPAHVELEHEETPRGDGRQQEERPRAGIRHDIHR